MRLVDRRFGSVTVVAGAQNGKYPDGNSMFVHGKDASALVDPSLTVAARDDLAGRADVAVLSHAHEDHVAGLFRFPDAEVHAHSADAPGLRSMAALMEMYGSDLGDAGLCELLVSEFHYTERPDTRDYEDGATFDLGGTRLLAIHTPGHTRGHCSFLVEPEGILFLGDIDLSSFGPYYGDACSSLEDFERSLRRVRGIDARLWVSYHHVGVIEERDAFLARLDRFSACIEERDRALLDFLREPRRMAEMVSRRFLYPARATAPYVDAAEERTIQQHLDRLLEQGAVERCEADGYRRISG